MAAENRKTKVINPAFQYRIAFSSILVVIITVNLLIFLASLFPQFLGFELKLAQAGYYAVGIVEVLIMIGCWKWSILATHRVAGPVYAVGRELAKLGEGNLLVSVNLRPKDEFKETADLINSSIGKLRERVIEVKHLAAALEEDPSELAYSRLKDALAAIRTDNDGTQPDQ